jgi:hypothetical protein
VASRASVRDRIDEFQDVYGSRAGSAAFRQQYGSDFSRSGQIQPPIQAKPSFRGLSQELAAESQPVQLREEENKTGLPDDLKAGVEALSGFSLDDVRVHYNSSKPAQLQALAYTQGTEIHVGPGHEKHLAHEAWHIVQQMQGRVKPTMQMKDGVPVNEDAGLENEADVMAVKAKKMGQKEQESQGKQKLIAYELTQQNGEAMRRSPQQKYAQQIIQQKVKITDNLQFNLHDGIPVIGESVLNDPPEYVNAIVDDNKHYRLKAGQNFISELKGKDYINYPDNISGADARLLKPMVEDNEPDDVRVVGDGHHKLLFSTFHGRECAGGTKIGFLRGQPWSALKWTKDLKDK